MPLVVRQRTSAQAERWIGEDASAVTWTLSGVEIASALWRLVRDGALAERAARAAETLVDELLLHAHVVADVERVKAVAGRLLRVHPLRAADALQLAAALVWADGHPSGLTVHTLDRRLGAAAAREGFRVLPAP